MCSFNDEGSVYNQGSNGGGGGGDWVDVSDKIISKKFNETKLYYNESAKLYSLRVHGSPYNISTGTVYQLVAFNEDIINTALEMTIPVFNGQSNFGSGAVSELLVANRVLYTTGYPVVKNALNFMVAINPPLNSILDAEILFTGL